LKFKAEDLAQELRIRIMMKLNQMSFEEFGRRRFLDFFSRTEKYSEDHEGGVEAGIGLAAFEGYSIDAAFASPIDCAWQTCEIVLDYDGLCPESESHELLKQPGLGLRKGMPYERVKDLLGIPYKDMPRFYLRFVVGEQWQYYVDCKFREREGLMSVWICRKDLADQQIANES
jgi:hypothetical protein